MAFKRAGWRSGLTYRQVCGQCKTEVIYTDEKLDFRPWYADGFIYCPNCQKPLRHNEKYAMGSQTVSPENSSFTSPDMKVEVCSQCGKSLCESDNFCPNCGTKRK